MLRILFFLLVCLVLTHSIFAQNISDKVTLKINLETVPTIQEVGLDEPQSYWKVSYKLKVADTENVEKAFVGNKLKKSILKGAFVTKGSFRRNSLALSENKHFSTQVIFNDKIKNLLRSNKAQTFIFEVKWKIQSKVMKNRLKALKKLMSQNKASKKRKLSLKHFARYFFPADPDVFGGISREGIMTITVGITEDFGDFSDRSTQ